MALDVWMNILIIFTIPTKRYEAILYYWTTYFGLQNLL